MDKNQWRELASDYIEGILPPQKAREVRAFLETDPEARADEQALRGITHQLSALPDVEPPLFFADNVMARLQREREEAVQPGWRAWLPNLGRIAVGSLAVGGVLAAAAWRLLGPAPSATNRQAGIVGLVGAGKRPATNVPLPTLSVSPVRVEHGSVRFSLTLDHAHKGSVLASVPGGTPTGVFLGESEGTTRSLSVPVDATMNVAAIRLVWTGDGTKGEQWILTPLHEQQPASTRASFGQGELPLTPQALAELAFRYGQTIVVRDIPTVEKISFDARNETLEELLRRHLGPLGMTVTQTQDRVVITARQ